MIGRIWHGWTSALKADEYENLLKSEIFEGIKAKNIEGFRNIQLLRRELNNEVEFITIMWFDNLKAVKKFAGEDYEGAVVLPKAQALLERYDKRSQHYEVLVE